MKKQLLLLCLLCFALSSTFASIPRLSRDGKTCQQILSSLAHAPDKANLANNSFVPLSVLLSSHRCKMVAKNWREGPFHSMQMPTPGLLEMFRTADEAAKDIIDKLGLRGKILSPEYDKRSPLEGAAATLELMEKRPPPAYIRNGVVFREGIFTVIPLMVLVEEPNSKQNKAMYAPLVAKGHQDLSQNDIYTAAFMAWALEPWSGKAPERAFIHLKPMAVKRSTKDSAQSDSTFQIDPRQYFPILREVYDEFISTVSDPQKLEDVQPRRCTECNRCPWASYCRGLMKESKDLSMMPLPPSADQAKVLQNRGIRDLHALASLKIKSSDFVELALRSGINTKRLVYMIAHAKAFKADKPLVLRPYSDPFEGKTTALHIDFEDLMDPNIRSGVYLFGVERQDLQKKQSEALEKQFIFAPELNQMGVDAAWAQFISYIKSTQDLKDPSWVMTMYSKHELVKFEQQFDIVRGPPGDFTRAQRRSPFYSEYGSMERPMGRLIRRQDFFEKYPDIHPTEIFELMDRTVDLLDYTRNQLAFPTYTNSIKQILKYVATKREPLSYPEGSNGLESMATSRAAYTRKEDVYFEKVRAYNEIDIDVNRLISDYVRQHSDTAAAPGLAWTTSLQTLSDDLDPLIRLKNKTVHLLKNKALIERSAHKPLLRWSENELEELTEILDRSTYMLSRSSVNGSDNLDSKQKAAKLQKLYFEFVTSRLSKLFCFIKSINPKLGSQENHGPPDRAFVELLKKPAVQFTRKHLNEMLMLSEMQKLFRKMDIHFPENPKERMIAPEEYLAKIETYPSLFEWGKTLQLTPKDIRKLWHGLYLQEGFGK